MARLVSKIYGEALFDFAKETNQVEKMYEEALDIIDVFNTSGEVKNFLANPKVSTDKKAEFVRELFVNSFWSKPESQAFRFFKANAKKGENPKIIDFLTIVIRKGRQKDIVPILKHFMHLTLNDKNIGEAYVVSASELSDDKKKKLEEKLVSVTKYETFIVDYRVDASLIGGLKIKIDDKVLDKTYKTKIFDMSKSLRGLKL